MFYLVKHRGFEPRTTWLKVKCSTDWANAPYKVPGSGIEPETRGFSVLCSTNWANQARSSGDRIWTYDLRVMSPTSFQTAPPRDINLKADDRTRTDNLLITNQLLCQLSHIGTSLMAIDEKLSPNGWRWIRTTEATCNRFTVCPLWPLGNPSIFLWVGPIGLEPMTLCL